ncbi:MAG: hypothetical protein ABIP94_01070 [Planctomycetota bacterium]
MASAKQADSEQGGASPASRPKKKRRWGFVLVALSAGCALALLAVELAFRLLWTLPPWMAEFQQAGMYMATPDRDTALQPGYRGTLQIGEAGVTTVAIDGLGMRGAEIGAKRPGERRVLVVGDSLVFGYGVDVEQALPAQLEHDLRAAGVDCTVGNGGVPSYGSKHAVAHMARLDGPFEADAFVVCGFLGNDAMDDVSPERTVYAGLMLQGQMARLVHNSWRTRLALRSRAALWLESWIFTNHPAWSPLTQLAPDPADAERQAGMPPQQPVDLSHAGLFLDVVDAATTWAEGAPPAIPRLLAILRSSLQRAKQVAGVRPLVFVVLPTVWQVSEQRRVARLGELKLDIAAYRRGLAQERWLGVARELGIVALDATPVLAAEPEPAGLFIADGGHFSRRGNAIVAVWLANELLPLLR